MTTNQTCPRCNWRLTNGVCRERGCSESWEAVFRERDEARAEAEHLRASRESWREDMTTARELISAALDGVPEFDDYAGYWWTGAAKGIEALRSADRG